MSSRRSPTGAARLKQLAAEAHISTRTASRRNSSKRCRISRCRSSPHTPNEAAKRDVINPARSTRSSGEPRDGVAAPTSICSFEYRDSSGLAVRQGVSHRAGDVVLTFKATITQKRQAAARRRSPVGVPRSATQ